MKPNKIPVTAEIKETKYRQTITPPSQDQIPEIVESLREIAHSGKLNCSVTMIFYRGGCTAIKTESAEEIGS